MNTFNSDFVSRLNAQYPTEAETILNGLMDAPTQSVRSNPAKSARRFEGEDIPWASSARYVNERPAYALDPHFHAGAYYPQEASSMILEQVYNKVAPKSRPIRVLDLCAAPGGKSTHLMQLLSKDSVLLSNEIVPKRYSILNENLIKWGAPNFITTNYRPEQLVRLGDIFDIVLVDAPCSGEGLFRKQESWREKWSIDNCNLCANRQRKIIDCAQKLVRPGGHLIYSTCTLNTAENIDQIHHLTDGGQFESIDMSHVESFGFEKIHDNNSIGYIALPHRVKGEPFFISCLKKNGSSEIILGRTSRILFQPLSGKLGEFKTHDFVSRLDSDLYDVNNLQQELSEHMENLKLRYYLPKLATYKKEIFIPNHFSAMCTNIIDYNREIEITRDIALAYLRHEPFSLEAPSKGWNVLSFEGVKMGWIKYDGRRIINKYPMNWRLRMTK